MNSSASLSLISDSSTTLVGFVYRVFHVESDRSYIGQTQQNPPSMRYKEHFKNSPSGAPKLQTAMRELGCTKFRAKVIETHRADSPSDLDILLRTREAINIDEYDAIENGYNCMKHIPGNTFNDKALRKLILELRRKHLCDDCPYRACSEAGLRIHNHTKHNGPFPFLCTWEGCAYKTKYSCGLERHTRRHTGEKPFSCTWEGCFFKAIDAGNVIKHMRTHTRVKKFNCTWEGCEFKTEYKVHRKNLLTKRLDNKFMQTYC